MSPGSQAAPVCAYRRELAHVVNAPYILIFPFQGVNDGKEEEQD
jgi:hypothetical protein